MSIGKVYVDNYIYMASGIYAIGNGFSYIFHVAHEGLAGFIGNDNFRTALIAVRLKGGILQ